MSAYDHRTAMPRVCRCHHPASKHLDVLDGECVTCTCVEFAPHVRESAPHREPVILPAAEQHLVSLTDAMVAEIDARPHHHVSGYSRRRRK